MGDDACLVARYRAGLDWMLTAPDWEGVIAVSIARCGFPGKRQGVGFRQAALALPLEAKAQSLRVALREELPSPPKETALRLARHWGLTQFKPDSGSARIGCAAWRSLRRQVGLRLGVRHLEYKGAQQRLYARFAHLALEEARHLCRSRARLDDATQEGRLAVLQAIDRIDPSACFASYARHWARRRIRNFLMREVSPVKAPINLISRALTDPADLEAPEHLASSPIRDWLGKERVSLEALGDQVTVSGWAGSEPGPDQQAAAWDDSRALQEALTSLTRKQQEVVALRFGLDGSGSVSRSLAEVATLTGISRQQVHQREQRALAKLAEALASVASERR